MRILMLTWEYPPYVVGGMGKHVAGLVPALANQTPDSTPLRVDVLTTRYSDGPAVERISPHVTIHRLETDPFDPVDMYNTVMDNNRYFVDYARRLAQDTPFDLVHCHDWLTGVAGVTLKHDYRVPLLSTIHATERGRNQGHLTSATSGRIDSTEALLSQESWRVIVCSQFMAGEMHGFFGTPADRIVIIPNGIDVAQLHPCPPNQRMALRAKYAPHGERLLFFVGRIVHEKGLHVLIRAMPDILAEFPNTRLLVAGRNSRHLLPLAQELGIEPAVKFLDFITDQQRDWLYQSVDAAIFPSLYEPFGIVALEAMALDCNVIVADVGGLSEVVRHEITGLRVYPNDPASIGWAVRRLFRDPAAAAQRRARAHQEVLDLYGWETIADATARLYSRICEERSVVIW
jgi:glycosyltransferase involved in cell wall biosynthesis